MCNSEIDISDIIIKMLRVTFTSGGETEIDVDDADKW